MNLELIKALIQTMIQRGIFNQQEIGHLQQSMEDDEIGLSLLNALINMSKQKARLIVSDEIATSSEPDFVQLNLDVKVTRILRQIGVPSHIKGYHYSREAIILVYGNMNFIGAITKKIYPTIAEKFNTSPTRVERAIRHAVELCFTKGNSTELNDMFPVLFKFKPTNGEFIATIADMILLDEKNTIRYKKAK